MADSCPRCHSSALGSPDGLLGHTHTPTPHPRERPQCTLQREDLITGARGISTLMRAQSLSHVRLLAAPWTAAPQSPLSMEFSREEYWRELPRPPPGDLPDPGIKLRPQTGKTQGEESRDCTGHRPVKPPSISGSVPPGVLS